MTIRQADKVDVYKGIMIPAGTPLFLTPLVTNFDPIAWGDKPDDFNPDRWDHLPEDNSNYSFMTFLQGRANFGGTLM
jgi:cytochrome P450